MAKRLWMVPVICSEPFEHAFVTVQARTRLGALYAFIRDNPIDDPAIIREGPPIELVKWLDSLGK